MCIIPGEFDLRFRFWNKDIGVSSADQFPSTALDALSKCDANVFPTVFQILKIFRFGFVPGVYTV